MTSRAKTAARRMSSSRVAIRWNPDISILPFLNSKSDCSRMDGKRACFILPQMRPDEQKYEEENCKALERLIEHNRKVVSRESGNNSNVPEGHQETQGITNFLERSE